MMGFEKIGVGALGVVLLILGLFVIQSENDPTFIILGIRIGCILGGISALIGFFKTL